MFDRWILSVFENVMAVLCIYSLFQKNIRVDRVFAGTCLSLTGISTMIMMFDNQTSLILIQYFILAVITRVHFRATVREIIINYILYFVILGGIELLTLFITEVLQEGFSFPFSPILAGVFALLFLLFLVKKVNFYQISYNLSHNYFFVHIILFLMFLSVFSLVVMFALQGRVDTIGWIIFTFVAIVAFILSEWGWYRDRVGHLEKELEIEKLYTKSFENLITDMRMRQHEFSDQINTIYSMHYMYKTYDELVNAQQIYSEQLCNESKFFPLLLQKENPVFIGFLYSKFSELDCSGIMITYEVAMKEIKEIPMYVVIDLVGNLINNAFEALKENVKEGHLYVNMKTEEQHIIEVCNTSREITQDELRLFLKKGYSSKGENRGIGLWHVNQICNTYGLKLIFGNKEIDGRNCFFSRLKIPVYG